MQTAEEACKGHPSDDSTISHQELVECSLWGNPERPDQLELDDHYDLMLALSRAEQAVEKAFRAKAGFNTLDSFRHSDEWRAFVQDVRHSFLNYLYGLLTLHASHTYHPAVVGFAQLAGSCAKTHGIGSAEEFKTSPTKAAVTQSLGEQLTHLAWSRRYARDRVGHTRCSRKNHRSASHWIDEHFRRRSRLLVVRIDLYYLKSYIDHRNMHHVDDQEALEHREVFVRGLHEQVPQGSCRGYLLKTEYKPKRGIHHHVLVLLDGSKVRQDITIAKALIDWWSGEVTQGRGSGFNTNLFHHAKETARGIGMITRSTQAVDDLKKVVVGYLCKPDYLMQWVWPGRRTFSKSNIPTSRYDHDTVPRKGRSRIRR